MPKKIEKTEEITLSGLATMINNLATTVKNDIDDLAIMVNDGFNAVSEQFRKQEKDISELQKDVSGLKKNVFVMGSDVKDLKNGQEKHNKRIDELEDVVKGVYRIEIKDLRKRVLVLEEKLGIVY